MAEAQDVNLLRRRGRRRLVGAIALVLLAAIVLPMVFDPEPKPAAPPVSVRIPSEDETGFAPKAAPKSAPPPAAAQAAPEVPKPAAVTPRVEEKPPQAAPAASPAPAPKPAPAASGEQFVVPVAALASQAKVNELAAKLKAARLPYYTEPIATAKGTVTRVRAGPFGTRAAAEEAQRQLERLGFKPGKVTSKS